MGPAASCNGPPPPGGTRASGCGDESLAHRSRFGEMRGDPVRVQASRSARSPEPARRLFEVSEHLTGVRFAFG